jgi:hypothetical protein
MTKHSKVGPLLLFSISLGEKYSQTIPLTVVETFHRCGIPHKNPMLNQGNASFYLPSIFLILFIFYCNDTPRSQNSQICVAKIYSTLRGIFGQFYALSTGVANSLEK